MTIRAIIPIKPLATAKQRLATILAPEARAALVAAMLLAVIKAARAAQGLHEVMLLSDGDYTRYYAGHGGAPLPCLADPGGGLNAALAMALRQAMAQNVTRLIILPADLPRLTPQDIACLMASAPDNMIHLAPDHHGTGTNALSLPLPAAGAFRFAFGEGSRAAHRAEATRLRLSVHEVLTTGLARDVDLPSDLDDPALAAIGFRRTAEGYGGYNGYR